MLSESLTFQTLKYMQSTGGDDGAVSGIMISAALKSFPDQLGSIYADYTKNADAFDTFNKSQAAHDVIVATSKVAEQEMKDKLAAH